MATRVELGRVAAAVRMAAVEARLAVVAARPPAEAPVVGETATAHGGGAAAREHFRRHRRSTP